MPELSFKDWVAQKAEEARSSERAQRRAEWLRAYEELKSQICEWLREDGGSQIQIDGEWIERNEMGLGIYRIEGLRITIGDSSVHLVPVSRNVIARIHPLGGGEYPGAGLVDITDGGTKHRLYRTIQDGTDVWYIVVDSWRPLESKRQDTAIPLTKESFEEILMDLMS
jgi:hypothetical protein